jgi:hypothetical protein
MMELLSPEEQEAFKQHMTVARWIKSTTESQVAPRRDWPQRLTYLKKFCESAGTDPDTMTKESIADNTTKNNYLRDMKKWVAAQDLSDREKHEAENMLRHYFMKQGFRMMTKPYSDVYKRKST